MNQSFRNSEGKVILSCMVKAIQDNKAYLGEVDGLIGDGDHGMNMNKGFTMFEQQNLNEEFGFAEGLEKLGDILLNEIGGSMGPIYGSVLLEMADAGCEYEEIGLEEFYQMLLAGLNGLNEIIEAKVGDKTIVDTLAPSVDSLRASIENRVEFHQALLNMKGEAQAGRDATKDMMAKFGRSSRLGERSVGVLDAGATSCCIILCAMADQILEML